MGFEKGSIWPVRRSGGFVEGVQRGWQAALVITIVLAVAAAYGATRRQQR
jgi:hypothetical protein